MQRSVDQSVDREWPPTPLVHWPETHNGWASLKPGTGNPIRVSHVGSKTTWDTTGCLPVWGGIGSGARTMGLCLRCMDKSSFPKQAEPKWQLYAFVNWHTTLYYHDILLWYLELLSISVTLLSYSLLFAFLTEVKQTCLHDQSLYLNNDYLKGLSNLATLGLLLCWFFTPSHFCNILVASLLISSMHFKI